MPRARPADECYIFGRERRDRPQLAIEVEWTRGGIERRGVKCGLSRRDVPHARGDLRLAQLDARLVAL